MRSTLLELEGPDEESRTPDEGGRRIIRLDEHRAWGWRVVNYIKYREIKSEQDRRESNRLAQARWREKNKPTGEEVSNSKQTSSLSKHPSAQSAYVDVDVKVDTEAKDQEPLPPSAPKPDKSRGTRLPDDWQPTEDLRAYAERKRPELNFTDQVESFRDYWHAKAGADARKTDWQLTFKTWIRNARSNGGMYANSTPSRNLSAVERVKSANDRAEREQRATEPFDAADRVVG